MHAAPPTLHNFIQGGAFAPGWGEGAPAPLWGLRGAPGNLGTPTRRGARFYKVGGSSKVIARVVHFLLPPEASFNFLTFFPSFYFDKVSLCFFYCWIISFCLLIPSFLLISSSLSISFFLSTFDSLFSFFLISFPSYLLTP